MSARLTLGGGGYGLVEAVKGEQVTLLCTRAFPPGSTLTLELQEQGSVGVKVKGSKKTDAGHFRVQGRLVNFSRKLRQALDEMLGVEDTLPTS